MGLKLHDFQEMENAIKGCENCNNIADLNKLSIQLIELIIKKFQTEYTGMFSAYKHSITAYNVLDWTFKKLDKTSEQAYYDFFAKDLENISQTAKKDDGGMWYIQRSWLVVIIDQLRVSYLLVHKDFAYKKLLQTQEDKKTVPVQPQQKEETTLTKKIKSSIEFSDDNRSLISQMSMFTTLNREYNNPIQSLIADFIAYTLSIKNADIFGYVKKIKQIEQYEDVRSKFFVQIVKAFCNFSNDQNTISVTPDSLIAKINMVIKSGNNLINNSFKEEIRQYFNQRLINLSQSQSEITKLNSKEIKKINKHFKNSHFRLTKILEGIETKTQDSTNNLQC